MESAPSSFYGVNELELIDDLNKISLSSDTSPSDASVYKDHDSDSSQPRDSSPAIKIVSMKIVLLRLARRSNRANYGLHNRLPTEIWLDVFHTRKQEVTSRVSALEH
ncbi:hypothetical protein L486_08251 [Kwoniella mangroviensis CBS 10435]|uniref:Uncharacterized protein n=1 Tax=Kwoniella mangroviensis CBS 10435 TaxID=1331196 RepID=A0A1B9IFU1_9TREE|nr:hypothetical protein L486_08251 [Kwoniella mangroviensis CBS 10435]